MLSRIFWLIFLLAAGVSAQIPEARRSAIEALAAQAMARDRIPAVSIAATLPDGTVFAGAWGMTDLENFVPATPRSIFRLASVSKPFTAAAAMLLAEEGKLDLDAPVQKYLPDYPRKQWPVTVRLLLGHLAGVRHYAGDEIHSTRRFRSLADGLKIFSADDLANEPGTKYLYSTYGYNLAGAVVEAAAGQPFPEFVRQRILIPAGGVSMRPDDVFALIPSRARGYRRRAGGEVENCGLADTSYKIPGGGWVATASDVARFAQALLQGKILSPRSLETMWTPQRLQDGRPTGYGLGWSVNRFAERRVLEHGGGQQGASTYLAVAPEGGAAVCVLTNLEGAPAGQIAREVLRMLLEAAQ
jgi:CubicO group peptidase (beta-lactamase class C family)